MRLGTARRDPLRHHFQRSLPKVVIAVTPALCAEALFASLLQPSDQPTREEVEAAVAESLAGHGGPGGCAAVLAGTYGEYPETAAARMRWALAIIAATGAFATAATR
jgi:hypothetical protein